MSDKKHVYRQLIDEIVHQAKQGQGVIGATRARAGVWNAQVDPQAAPDQYNYNMLLSRLTQPDREILAEMLSREFQRGVHTVLGTLHSAGIAPFETGYQGSPAQDFMGRMGGWRWPA